MNGRSVRAVVLHWNRPEECVRTVHLLADNGVPLAIEVVDNASETDRFETLRKGLPNDVVLRRLDSNRGWGGGLNVVLRDWLNAGSERWAIVSAHDAMPAAGCVARLLEVMERESRLGVCCPQYPDAAIARFHPVRGQWIEPGDDSMKDAVALEPMDFVHGTLMAFRRECLEEIGVFDERYFAHGDETEIALRARRHGWLVGQVRGAVVVNPHSWTPDEMKGYLSTRGSLLLARDYGGRIAALLRVLLVLANTARMMASGRAMGLSSASARLSAVRDFLIGRHGAPPSALPRAQARGGS